MMENVKVSVLVAVFNAEKYLECCLDSLLNQTLREIQVLCVDDASTDSSWQILQRYAALDTRVEIFQQPLNMGQAKARNLALHHAKGQYTCFLDSDDYLAEDALRLLVECFEKDAEVDAEKDAEMDAVLFDCHYVYPDGREKSYQMPSFAYLSGKEAFRKSLDWQIHGVYAVRTSIHLRFPYDESSHAYSDDNTTRLHYLASRKVGRCDGIYYYRQHAGSVTHRVSVRRFDYLLANFSMRKQMLELGVGTEDLAYYENLRWLNIVGLVLYAFRYRLRGLSLADYEQGMRVVKQMWMSIDVAALPFKLRYKFGYIPFRSALLPRQLAWHLFLLQERFYYQIRRMLGNLPD